VLRGAGAIARDWVESPNPVPNTDDITCLSPSGIGIFSVDVVVDATILNGLWLFRKDDGKYWLLY
jgi:hypothetical protein